MGNGDEERRDARERLCSSVANVGETSTRVRGSSVGRVCVGGSGENTKRDGENDSEVQPKMTNEAVLGELGWWTLKGRRDLLRLKYYGKIVRMGEDRLVKQEYVESRRD